MESDYQVRFASLPFGCAKRSQHEGEIHVEHRRYLELVIRRKRCRACDGLVNPAEPSLAAFDSEEIGPWSHWQGALDASMMVVGQDWGDTTYYLRHQGCDQAQGNPTNENLRRLLSSIGFEIGTPGDPEPESAVFLTNLILCLKSGGLQGPVKARWFTNCVRRFFRDLLMIVRPAVVVSLGELPSRAILREFGVRFDRKRSWNRVVEAAPYELAGTGSVLFPAYHCGAWGVNRNRPFSLQLGDWARIGQWLSRSANCR